MGKIENASREKSKYKKKNRKPQDVKIVNTRGKVGNSRGKVENASGKNENASGKNENPRGKSKDEGLKYK